MPFEELDNRIKELIEQHSPDYDEKSWPGMEKLLDKHLPQGKNKRRGLLIFLFSVLLLGSGAAFLLYKNYSQKEERDISGKNIRLESIKANEKINQLQTLADKEEVTIINELKSFPVKPNPVLQNEKTFHRTSQRKPGSGKIKDLSATNATAQESTKNNEKTSNIIKITEKGSEKSIESFSDTKTNLINQNENLNPVIKNESVKTKTVEITTSPLKENVTSETKSIPVNTSAKNKKSILANIVFSISAGPDISKVGQSDAGEVKLTYGAGLGYRISNRFSIHTGFYVGRKIYTAAPEDYNPPSNFWTYYPNLEHVDAECNVFEVPVNIYYDFNISEKQNWFVSAGLSSIFMKKEEYNYYYKPINSPQYVYYSRTYENKNKHYFSILNLSGGYARKLSSTVSVKAEPYAKIALTGIGYGKVKLNSGGILFSAIIQPFNTENKKVKK